MDGIWTCAKENYDLIGWMVGFIGVVIAVISLVLELKNRKEGKVKE